VGARNLIALGVCTMGISFIFFGKVVELEQNDVLIALSLSIRFLQGLSSTFVQTPCYSMATNDFPERTEEIVSWVEATTGIGLIVGPILGSALYSIFGFSKTFEYYGIFLILLGVLVKFNFPDSKLVSPDN